MSELILHQYMISPFSEKVRKVLAFKQLSWAAVEQPNIAPKPNLTPLTGGYRRIPVLQIGAHVYCDTALIIEQLDRLHPETLLTPPELLGQAQMLADWADHRVFAHSGLATISELLHTLPKEFMEDRAKMSPGFASSGADPNGPAHARAQIGQACAMVERQLAHTPYLLGARFTLADAAVFHVLNFATLAPTSAAMIGSYAKLSDWLQRIIDMGEGTRTDMAPDAALAIAQNAAIDTTPPADAVADAALTPGQQVVIQADDYGQETTEGELVWLRDNEIAVKRVDAQVGEVMVHYPRVGYRITAA